MPDGRAVTEQVAVFAKGTRVFQAIALGDKLDAEAADTLLRQPARRAMTARGIRVGVRATCGPAVAVVLSFAFAYFFSALLRAVTATLAPVFSARAAAWRRPIWACWPAPTSWALRRCSCRWAVRSTASGRGACCWCC